MTRNLLSLLKSAIALAETLSFSRAARMRHISQPTLTKHISALEDWLGISIFDRNRQMVAITDAGRALLRNHDYLYYTLTERYTPHARSYKTPKLY